MASLYSCKIVICKLRPHILFFQKRQKNNLDYSAVFGFSLNEDIQSVTEDVDHVSWVYVNLQLSVPAIRLDETHTERPNYGGTDGASGANSDTVNRFMLGEKIFTAERNRNITERRKRSWTSKSKLCMLYLVKINKYLNVPGLTEATFSVTERDT